jgi:hypothetical protein
MIDSLPERIASKIWPEPNSGCWLWGGTLNNFGYGTAYVMGGRAMAHRFVYEQLVGPIPAGLHIDHLCRNPSCVNPSHLEPVTQRENIRRGNGFGGRHAKQTHCVNGHPFDEKNTAIRSLGRRVCRACSRARDIVYGARKKAARG